MILFLASLIRKTISVSLEKSFLGPGVWPGWGQPIIFQLLGGLQLGTGSWPLSINKPTAPLLSLPNMDNYTATRASGPPAFSSTLTFFAPFYSTPETAVSVKVNLRPYLRELFLATDPLYISLSLNQIAFCSASNNHGLPKCPASTISKSECPNPAAQGSNNMQQQNLDWRSLLMCLSRNLFTSSYLGPGALLMGMPLMGGKRDRWHSRQVSDSNQLHQG